jgi:AraC-like DNA-binding protein
MKNIHRPADARIRIALSVVERQFHNPALRLQNLAALVGLSRCYLSHSIKSATGSGFRDHLRRVRIDSAFVLLMNPKLSVKEVAMAVGFNSTGTFDREFNRVTGVSPTSWRYRSWETAQLPKQKPTDRNSGA